jgi:hypothetical protein
VWILISVAGSPGIGIDVDVDVIVDMVDFIRPFPVDGVSRLS